MVVSSGWTWAGSETASTLGAMLWGTVEMDERRNSDPSQRVNRSFPLAGLVGTWRFRIEEKSNGHYVVEGRAADGRIVSRAGTDPEHTLAKCVEDAKGLDACSNS